MSHLNDKIVYSDIVGFNAYGNIELLTNNQMKGRSILWAHCIPSGDPADFLQPGDFIILYNMANMCMEQISAQIDLCKDHALSGILFVGTGRPFTDLEKEQLALLGNKAKLPLLYSANLSNVSSFCKEICRHVLEQASFKSIRDQLIDTLLTSTDYDKQAVMNTLLQLGFNPQTTYCCAVFRISSQSRTLSPGENTAKLQEVLSAIHARFDCFVCGSEFDGKLVAILPDSYKGESIYTLLIELVKKANTWDPGIFYCCGVGPRWTDISDFRNSMEVGMKLARLPHRLSVRDIQTQVIFRVLCQFDNHQDLFELYMDIFGNLIRYDMENGTDLMRCLKIYLENGQNLTLAAQEAFLHVNTFRSRIAKIEELLNYDLRGDRWNMFRYYFCFFVEDFLSSNTNLLDGYPSHSHLTHRDHFGLRPAPNITQTPAEH